jgi:hypothetical protein
MAGDIGPSEADQCYLSGQSRDRTGDTRIFSQKRGYRFFGDFPEEYGHCTPFIGFCKASYGIVLSIGKMPYTGSTRARNAVEKK